MLIRYPLLLTAIHCLFSVPLAAQEEWSQQDLPSGINALYGVFFNDSQTGWAVGRDGFFGPGTIVHTSDGGSNWQRQQPSTDATLNAVHFVSNTVGWVVGSEGTILHTTDGGQSWEAQNSGSGFVDLVSVHFINATTGWATGFAGFFSPGVILRTSNGGQSWEQDEQPDSDGVEWTKVQFVDDQNGWILGSSGDLLRTTDGGNTWSRTSITASTTLTDLHFVDTSNGWVVGYDGTILRSTDGGTSWTTQTVPEPGSPGYLDAVHFADANNGWAAGGEGTVLHTTNGGNTWSSTLVGSGITRFYDVHFPDAGNGWVVGFSGSSARVFHLGQAVGLQELGQATLTFGLNPNPAVDHSSLTFTMDEQHHVLVELFDLHGRAVRTAFAGTMPPGDHRLPLSAEGLAPGTYLCRLRIGDRNGTRRMVIDPWK